MTLDPESGVLSNLRAAARLAAIVALTLVFAPVQGLLLLARRGDPYAVPRLFHRLVLRALGIKVRVQGEAAANGLVLYVSNHTSYLDAIVMGSILSASFVAKAEVARWPLLGLLSRLQHTAFIERRAVRAAEQRDSLRQRLARGESLIFFPEGTSSDGQHVLPFKSTLFSLAELPGPDGKPPLVQPVTILCTGLGGLPIGRAWRPYYAWFGDMTLVPHLWRVLKIGRFTVDVVFHAPVTIGEFHDRKKLAAYCCDVINKGAERLLAGRN